MRNTIAVFFVLLFSVGFAQTQTDRNSANKDQQKPTPKAAYDQYRIITLQKDTTYVDTSLTIQKEYAYNYLRKDSFGLLPFANEGQTYTVLDFGFKKFAPYPEIGYAGKHFNFMKANDIQYYSVATPVTELYFKTVMEQGQCLDALIAVNTSERFNMSVAFKGLRSLGKYVNQLSSTGNFRFTSSYNTLNKRYYLNFHFTGQDILNGENGGITTLEDFEGEDPAFQNRARLEVYLRDAKSFLKGKRFFIDHSFLINKKKGNNNLYINHQFNYETKFFEYNQATVASTVGNTQILRFGEAYVSSNINDQNRYNRLYNKFGATYENSLLGTFRFFIEDFRYNYFYDNILVLDSGVIPSSLNDEINTVGGEYEYRKNKWRGTFQYANSITNQPLSNLDAKLHYQINPKNELEFQYQMLNKIPDHIYNLHQSSFAAYNWYNDFKNEKINNLFVTAKTQWVEAALQATVINDYLFFSNDAVDTQQQFVTPKQYDKTINYLSVKVSREFKWWKLALDNTVLYQQVDQEDDILNVPQIVTRNTFYFTDYFFQKALYLQTGFTLNYFTKFYGNDYNPVIADAFVQNQTQFGDFPMVDFFVNARIRQTRIFFKLEHLNSRMTGNNFYTAPNYPYRDFMIRFGLVWNFFQ
ncbi:putative porin [Flavobacterium sp.]|uniref:putative porin n=1 Tax=Flavobacterium sp. TaxID=239 RepID=UPI002FDE1DF6